MGGALLLGRAAEAHAQVGRRERGFIRRRWRRGEEPEGQGGGVRGCDAVGGGAGRYADRVDVLLGTDATEGAEWEAKGYVCNMAERSGVQFVGGDDKGAREQQDRDPEAAAHDGGKEHVLDARGAATEGHTGVDAPVYML